MTASISFSSPSPSQTQAIELRFVALKPKVSTALKECGELKTLLPKFIAFLKDGTNARHSEQVAHFLMGKIDARQLPQGLQALGETFNSHEHQSMKTELYELVATHRYDSGIMGFFFGQAEPSEKTIAKLEWLNARLYENPNSSGTCSTSSSATAKLNDTEPKLKQAYADETNKAQCFLNDYNVSRAVADGLLDANFGEPRTLSVDDVIPPEKLKDLVPYKDFVLLRHNAARDTLNAIKKDGIKSLKCLAEDANSSEQLKSLYKTRVNKNEKKFSNDPNLIYFRPILNVSNIPDNQIIIAVKPQSVFVFDQEDRVRSSGTAGTYRESAMSIKTYFEAVENCPAGRFLDRYRGYTPYSVLDYRMQRDDDISYIPECCFSADRIDPKFFVTV